MFSIKRVLRNSLSPLFLDLNLISALLVHHFSHIGENRSMVQMKAGKKINK